MPTPDVIAIDGPVASGKTTVGRALARRLGYRFVDTGLMYRALTVLALREGIDLGDAEALGRLAAATEIALDDVAEGPTHVRAGGEELTAEVRTPQVEDAVSLVSQVATVRDAMVAQQQRIAQGGRVVMVGRDIGTKVLPDAAKVYLDASVDERVRRRLAEVAKVGEPPAGGEGEVRENVKTRDRIDSQREEGPLRAADDALRVATEGLDVDGVVDYVIERLETA